MGTSADYKPYEYVDASKSDAAVGVMPAITKSTFPELRDANKPPKSISFTFTSYVKER
jgi:hypothetical protein